MVVMFAEIGAGVGIAGLILAVLRARRRARLDKNEISLREKAQGRPFVRRRSCGWRHVSRA